MLGDGQEPTNGFAVPSRRAEGSHTYSYTNRSLYGLKTTDLQSTSLQTTILQTTSLQTPAKR
jgi:hypothetical protein